MKAQFPYNGYELYVTYHSKEKRRYANLIATDHRTTISYAKYLLEVKLGRLLIGDEEADHIDGNKMNDSIENIQILDRLKNIKKSAKSITWLTKNCVICNAIFVVEKQQSKTVCCSRKCGYVKVSRTLINK